MKSYLCKTILLTISGRVPEFPPQRALPLGPEDFAVTNSPARIPRLWSISSLSVFFFSHTACGILVPPREIEPRPSAVRAQSPNHWTAREFPSLLVFFFFFKEISILIFIYLFILFMAVLGFRFCARAFSSCGKRGPLFIAVRGPLTVAASLVVEHRLQTRRLSSCGSRA